jgi:hypothetical protein
MVAEAASRMVLVSIGTSGETETFYPGASADHWRNQVVVLEGMPAKGFVMLVAASTGGGSLPSLLSQAPGPRVLG